MQSTWKYADAHAQLNGPGDSRPTAMQIIENEGVMGNLKGLVAVVTGASSGLGIETVRALHAAGADVIAPVRNLQKGEDVLKDIKTSNAKYSDAGSLKLMHVDLNSLSSVRQFADDFNKEHRQLNLLINNAGELTCTSMHCFNLPASIWLENLQSRSAKGKLSVAGWLRSDVWN
jgi:NAD(P)-dependent dehydrogenase (short-subunit alcohol dehydrogenase family)